MLFTDPTFLYLFLPAVLFAHTLLPGLLGNMALLLASLVFYAWGEGVYVLVMLASIAGNYAIGRVIGGSTAASRRGGLALGVGVAFNLALLGYFKYSGWLAAELAAWLGSTPSELTEVHLPIGISFFTFQALSYLVDVRRGHVSPARGPLDFALYISLFPQLIAGPIVRYRDIAADLVARRRPLALRRRLPGESMRADLAEFAAGARRFVIGLAKKVLVADVVAVPADAIFGLGGEELTPGLAWLGILCYSLQIYFDFSGYSDMAIGIGRMLGFHFPENFLRPYSARSVTEFWRRWHVSLSTWFRDYLYVPLGGSRRGRLRTYCNLTTVFLLCGLWHGPAWNFVAWGAFHGLFLVLERGHIERLERRLPGVVLRLYLLVVVAFGWVLFRADGLEHAVRYWSALTGLDAVRGPGRSAIEHLSTSNMTTLVVACLIACPRASPWRTLRARVTGRAPSTGLVFDGVEVAAFAAALVWVAATLAAGTHTPFLYFRF